MANYTTANGTPFTTFEFLPEGGSLAQYALPDHLIDSPDPVNMLVYCRASSGNHTQFTGSHVPFRNKLIDNGWGWVETVAKAEDWGIYVNNWGSPRGVEHYRLAYDYMAERVNVGNVFIMGLSHGGMAAVNLYLKEPYLSRKAKGLIVLNGTQDLTYRIQWQGLAQFYVPYEMTEAEFLATVPDHDPLQYPLEMWAGKNVLHVVGDADDLVPPERHGLALRQRIHGAARESSLYVNIGGSHGTHNVLPAAWDFIQRTLHGLPVTKAYANYEGETRSVLSAKYHNGTEMVDVDVTKFRANT
jgi:dienelactone hydrolase